MPTIRDVRPTFDTTLNRPLTSYNSVTGLEKLIYEALELGLTDSVFGWTTIAGTIEATLGAVYFDSDPKKVKEVMDTPKLVSKPRRLERKQESDGVCHV